MKVRRALVCAPRMPEFDREGGSQRTFHLIQLLRESGWAVSLIAYNATDGERYGRILRQLGVAVYAGADSSMVGDEYLPDPTALIATGGFDLAILTFWTTAEYFTPMVRNLSPTTRVIVDSIDLHFLRHARTLFGEAAAAAVNTADNDGQRPGKKGLNGASLTPRRFGALTTQYADEFIREINAYAGADAVLTVSRKEADVLNDLVGDPDLAMVVPLMEDLPPSALSMPERRGILFVGNYRHPPNREAVTFLLTEVLPRVDPSVLHNHPVYLVGNGLDKIRTTSPYVRVVGWVPSLLHYLQTACLSVVPVRTGAGTKTKLIQSLTVGTPAVSTATGIEGLDLREGEHVLVADEPDAFAQAVERLTRDVQLWELLSTRGREHVTARHGHDAVRARFFSAVMRELGHPMPTETAAATGARIPDGESPGGAVGVS